MVVHITAEKDATSLSRQALEASWPSRRNYTSWQKRFNKLRAELGMQEETLQARVREGHLPSFRAYVRWSIYERDRTVREEGARTKSTLATYMHHYNDRIQLFQAAAISVHRPFEQRHGIHYAAACRHSSSQRYDSKIR